MALPVEAINFSANVAEENVLLATNSINSLQAIRKLYPNSPIVQKIEKAIGNGDENFRLCWVPSLVGIHGNKSANILAVQATTHALST